MSILSIPTPRVFLPLLEPARYKGAHGGRGSGKSHFFAELLIEACLMRTTRAVCIREIQKSIKQSVKLLLEDKIKALGVADNFRILDDLIEAPHGGLIIFQGMQNHTADSIKSLEGYDIAWVEEAHSLSQRSLDLLRPTIRKPGSELWFSWNPETQKDPVDMLLRGEKRPKDAVVVEVSWRDNPWFPDVLRQEMEEDKERNFDKYLHVWEGHYIQALEGAVYAEELRKATEEKRITRVPYDSSKPVATFWDLGWADHTSIWFAQSIGHEFRIIDYYQNHLKKAQHYIAEMQSRGYVYDRIFLPHDAANESMNAERTIEQIVRAAFPNAQVTVLENPGADGLKNGIQAARTIFGQCWFDEVKCAEGLEALRHYRYERDEASGEWSKKPLHNWASHAADSWRYLATAIQGEQRKRKVDRGSISWLG